MISIVLLAISIVLAYIFALKQIYQVQITEYRFDRFRTMLRDSGISNFFLPKLIYPAKTARNIMIALLSLALFLTLNFVFLNIAQDNLILLSGFFFLNYIIIKVIVLITSALIRPFGDFARRRTVGKAKEMVGNSKTEMIGVTGSFGKSSMKEFLYQILSEKYKVERTSGNRNTDIGVALEIKEKLSDDLDFFVCEMGAYKIGEIENICNFVKPRYGVLVGIGNQHMDLFGSIENLVQAKSELMKALPEDGVGVINIDNPYQDKLLEGAKCKTITYGWSEKADYKVTSVNYKGRLMFVEFEGFGKNYKFTTALLGKHQAVNLLAVVALALELKVSYEVIQNAIAKMEPLESKLSLHSGVNDSIILNDGYNSNLEGFLSGLEVAKSFNAENKYAFNYGIFELGKEREGAYKKVVESVVEGDIKLLTLDKRFLNFNSEKILL